MSDCEASFDPIDLLHYGYRVLENYFHDGPYRFQMQFGRGTLAEFYGPTGEHDEILGERRQWLQSSERSCLVWTPEAGPFVREAFDLAIESGTVPALAQSPDSKGQARYLGEHWEPDYLLLSMESGAIRLICACVCFPSSWSVEEKIGRRIDEIHGVVPDLNQTIGRQISTFLEKLKPGISWTRSNWGLSRSAERNQHPNRKLTRLDSTIGPSEVFFRVEEQSLVALPRTSGILFGIRIKVTPLVEFIGTAAGDKLRFALETMPEPMAQYKGLSVARTRIIQLLERSRPT